MTPKCAQAAMAAVGRKLSQAELDNLEARIKGMLRPARDELLRQGQAVTPDAITKLAAEMAGTQLQREAAKKQWNTVLAVKAHARILDYLAEREKAGMDGLSALDRLLAFNAKGDAHTISVETQMKTIRDFALSRMVRTLEATNPRFSAWSRTRAGSRPLPRNCSARTRAAPRPKRA